MLYIGLNQNEQWDGQVGNFAQFEPVEPTFFNFIKFNPDMPRKLN